LTESRRRGIARHPICGLFDWPYSARGKPSVTPIVLGAENVINTKVSLGSVRILCVDDNHDLADSEALLLELVGYEARACYDGTSALKLAETFRPCICLIDMNMPGMDGDELAERLREEGHPPVLVAVTAMNNEASSRRIENAGFDHHLVKPVDPARLLSVVNKLREVC
jgi:two-component system, OmpR family, response regulator